MVANLASAPNATLTGASTNASTTATAGAYSASGATVASKSATDQTALAGNFDTFLKLLTAQLKHQDPLSPMDTAQFTNQLVQFSAVEQQININSNLEKMLANQNSGEMSSAVNYLGQTVQGVSTSLPLQGGQANFAYTTPANSSKVSIVISDQAGNVVKTMTGDATAGTHKVAWDGTNAYGTQQNDGAYNISVNATGSDGSQTPVDAAVSGQVTSVGMDSSNAIQLYMGSVNLPLAKVIEVQLPSSATSTPPTTTPPAATSTGAAAAATQAVNNAINGITGTTTN